MSVKPTNYCASFDDLNMKCRVNTTISVCLTNYHFPIQSKPLPLNRCVFACVWHMSDCFVASPLHLVRCVSNTLQAQTSFVLLISFYSLRSAHLIKLNRNISSLFFKTILIGNLLTLCLLTGKVLNHSDEVSLFVKHKVS